MAAAQARIQRFQDRPPGPDRDLQTKEENMEQLTRADFERLLEFRSSLRRFQRWSEDQARAAGLTHVQHELLVAIVGHHGSESPTVSELAHHLLLRHHSTIELVNRAEAGGFVRRSADPRDGRLVRVALTGLGQRLLTRLTPAHLVQLHSLAAVLDELVADTDA
jgi:DNA-binding MarR family transcriptional regulator